jgi:hypothetical protein
MNSNLKSIQPYFHGLRHSIQHAESHAFIEHKSVIDTVCLAVAVIHKTNVSSA